MLFFRDTIISYFTDSILRCAPIFIKYLLKINKPEDKKTPASANNTLFQNGNDSKSDTDSDTIKTITTKERIEQKPKQRCTLCYQKIPSSWTPHSNWKEWYKKTSPLLKNKNRLKHSHQLQNKLKTYYSETNSESESEIPKSSTVRTNKIVKANQVLMPSLDESLVTDSSSN